MIVEAIELKKKISLGDYPNLYAGYPGDFLITTVNGNQAIVSKEVYKDLKEFEATPRTQTTVTLREVIVVTGTIETAAREVRALLPDSF